MNIYILKTQLLDLIECNNVYIYIYLKKANTEINITVNRGTSPFIL